MIKSKSKIATISGKKYIISDPTIENTSLKVCFHIEGKNYRLSAGSIIYDHYLKMYVLKTNIQVENGVIGIDKETDKPIFGGFSYPPTMMEYEFIQLHHKKMMFICINENIFNDTNWQEQLSTGIYYQRTKLPVAEFNRLAICDQEYKKGLPYNASESITEASKIFTKNYKPTYCNALTIFPKLAKDYTFGLEFETVKGQIPKKICDTLGLIPVRDGSVKGIEYATIPLSGKKGLQAVLDSAIVLDKRTSSDTECSLHVHVGNLPRTEKFFIALTKVLCHIQEDMYNHFPFAIRGGYGFKSKDYTAPLPAIQLLSQMDAVITNKNLKSNFAPIFEFLSMGQVYKDFGEKLSNVKSHPSDPQGTSKWYVKSRYKWVNMIPLLFGNKQTIEFRIHTPTTHPDKIMYFLTLVFAIVDMAKNHQDDILNNNLHASNYNNIINIMHVYCQGIGTKYAKYYDLSIKYWSIRHRYIKDCTRKGDFYADEDSFIISNSISQAIFSKTSTKNIALNKEFERFLLFGTAGNPEATKISTRASFGRFIAAEQPTYFASPPVPRAARDTIRRQVEALSSIPPDNLRAERISRLGAELLRETTPTWSGVTGTTNINDENASDPDSF